MPKLNQPKPTFNQLLKNSWSVSKSMNTIHSEALTNLTNYYSIINIYITYSISV